METDEESVPRPLTPVGNKIQTDTTGTIDVKADEDESNGTNGKAIEGTPNATSTPGPPNSASQKSAKSGSARKGRGKKAIEGKPYEGLFEATLKMSEGPMAWEITDLRPNIVGGDRSWIERAECMICNHRID